MGFISALNITAGEPLTFSVGTTNNLYWDVVGNSSNLTGLNITQEVFSNYSNITITTEYWYKPDNFTLIFFDIKTKEVIKEVYSGGGGSGRTTYVDRNITKEVERVVYVNQTIGGEVTDKEVEKDEPKSYVIELLGTIIGLLIIGFVYLILKLRRKLKVNRSVTTKE